MELSSKTLCSSCPSWLIGCCRRGRTSSFSSFGGFLGLACFFFTRKVLWTDTLIIGRRFEQFFHVEHIALIGCDLKVVVHFDGIERAILSAEAAVHADVRVNEELGRLGDGATSRRVV